MGDVGIVGEAKLPAAFGGAAVAEDGIDDDHVADEGNGFGAFAFGVLNGEADGLAGVAAHGVEDLGHGHALGRSVVDREDVVAGADVRSGGWGAGVGGTDDHELGWIAAEADADADAAELLPELGAKRIGIIAADELGMFVAVLMEDVDHAAHGGVVQLFVGNVLECIGADFAQRVGGVASEGVLLAAEIAGVGDREGDGQDQEVALGHSANLAGIGKCVYVWGERAVLRCQDRFRSWREPAR